MKSSALGKNISSTGKVVPQNRSHAKANMQSSVDAIVKSLLPLMRQLKQAQQRAKKLGIFIGDPEQLITCPKCGLHEDIAFSGMIQVTRPPHLGEDTGLRFKTVRRRPNYWRCPDCKKEFKVPDESIL